MLEFLSWNSTVAFRDVHVIIRCSEYVKLIIQWNIKYWISQALGYVQCFMRIIAPEASSLVSLGLFCPDVAGGMW